MRLELEADVRDREPRMLRPSVPIPRPAAVAARDGRAIDRSVGPAGVA